MSQVSEVVNIVAADAGHDVAQVTGAVAAAEAAATAGVHAAATQAVNDAKYARSSVDYLETWLDNEIADLSRHVAILYAIIGGVSVCALALLAYMVVS